MSTDRPAGSGAGAWRGTRDVNFSATLPGGNERKTWPFAREGGKSATASPRPDSPPGPGANVPGGRVATTASRRVPEFAQAGEAVVPIPRLMKCLVRIFLGRPRTSIVRIAKGRPRTFRHFLSWKPLFYHGLLPALRALGPARGDAILGGFGRALATAWPPRRRELGSALEPVRPFDRSGRPCARDRQGPRGGTSCDFSCARLPARRRLGRGILRAFDVEGFEHVEHALAEGRGLILVGSHLGAHLSAAHWARPTRGAAPGPLIQRPAHVSDRLNREFDDATAPDPQSGFSSPVFEPRGGLEADLPDTLRPPRRPRRLSQGDVPWTGPNTRPGRLLLGSSTRFNRSGPNSRRSSAPPVVAVFCTHLPGGRDYADVRPPDWREAGARGRGRRKVPVASRSRDRRSPGRCRRALTLALLPRHVLGRLAAARSQARRVFVPLPRSTPRPFDASGPRHWVVETIGSVASRTSRSSFAAISIGTFRCDGSSTTSSPSSRPEVISEELERRLTERDLPVLDVVVPRDVAEIEPVLDRQGFDGHWRAPRAAERLDLDLGRHPGPKPAGTVSSLTTLSKYFRSLKNDC